jgi:uncharacterized protein (DUF1015 family)
MTGQLGVRPARLRLVDPDLAPRVSAPPADAPAQQGVTEPPDPLSYRNVLRATGDPATRAAELRADREALERLLAADVFGPPHRRFAWYRLRAGDHVQVGLVAEVAIRDYLDGRIARHEHTRAEREELLAEHQRVVGADASPVALAFRSDTALRTLAARATRTTPHLAFTSGDGVEHTLWPVDDAADVHDVCGALRSVDRLYITDGHHRFAAAATIAAASRAAGADDDADDQWVLATLFPHDELRIMAFHRAVTRPRGPTASHLLGELASCGDVRPLDGPRVPDRPHRYTILLDGHWYALAVDERDVGSGLLERLDVTVLHEHVLAPVLGLREPRFDPRLSYVSGGPAQVAAHCAHRHAIGFMLRPTGMDELMAVADAELVMPPKSTLFAPKVRAGLVLRRTG